MTPIETLEARREGVQALLTKARAVHRAGNPQAAATLRRRARAYAHELVADAQALRDAAAQLAADAVTQGCEDAAALAARMGGEAA